MSELERLCDAAGLVVVGRVTQNLRTPNARTFLGKGKISELREVCGVESPDVEGKKMKLNREEEEEEGNDENEESFDWDESEDDSRVSSDTSTSPSSPCKPDTSSSGATSTPASNAPTNAPLAGASLGVKNGLSSLSSPVDVSLANLCRDTPVPVAVGAPNRGRNPAAAFAAAAEPLPSNAAEKSLIMLSK